MLKAASRRTGIAAAALVVTALISAPAAAPVAAAPTPAGISVVGRLPLTSPCFTHSALGFDHALNVVLVAEQHYDTSGKCAISSGDAIVRLMAFSMSNNSLLVDRPVLPPPTIAQGLSTKQLTVDEVGHRLFLPFRTNSPGGSNDVLVYSIPAILHGTGPLVASADIQVPSVAPLASSTSPGGIAPQNNPTGPAGDAVIVPTGMTYVRAEDALYLVMASAYGGTGSWTSTHGPGATDVFIAKVHVADGALLWFQPLDQCTFSPTLSTGSFFAADDPIAVISTPAGRLLITGCVYTRAPAPPAGSFVGAAANQAGSMLSYVVPMDAGGKPIASQIAYYVGRPNVITGVVDATTGRMFWPALPPHNQGDTATSGASASGPAAAVFDSVHGSYVGAPSVGDAGDNGGVFLVAAGGGRYYAVGHQGVLVGDASATPPGQGVVYGAYHCPVNTGGLDSVRRVLYVEPVADCNSASPIGAPYIVVLRDDLPSVATPTPPAPDSYTTQVDEQAGRTTVQHSGHAEASGSRVRLVGGPGGFAGGATLGAYDLALTGQSASPLDRTSREVSLGLIQGSNLDNYQASSNAISSLADDTTAQQATGNQVVANWPFKQVHCSDPGSKTASSSEGSDTGATVKCDEGASTTQAESSAGPLGLSVKLLGPTSALSVPVAVAQSVTSTHVWVDGALGAVSEAHAIARGINLGVAGIDTVETTMRCVAHGRTKTASCTYTRLISGAASGGQPLGGGACTEVESASGSTGSCATLLAALNSLRPGQVVFKTPEPDTSPNTLKGSPGGYQAVGKRELYEHLQDDVINYDPSSQVPGLEVTYVNDTAYNPSRVNVQLAGTEAESHYGIHPATTDDLFAAGGGGALDSALQNIPPFQSGGEPIQLNAAVAPATPPGVYNAIQRVVRRLFEGIAILLRSPVTGLVVATLLLMMAAPLGIAWRRRCLLIALSGG